jgi:hypothetical protein
MPIYRGTTPLKAYRGGNLINIYVGDRLVENNTLWFIEHGAGLLDLAVTGATGLLWTFPDGTTSTATRPKKTVPAGITRCYAANWASSGVAISSNWVVQTAYHGNVKDLPRVTSYLSMWGCSQVTGALADLPRVTSYLSMWGCSHVTGALADLPRVTSTLSMWGCSQVTGALSPSPTLKTIYLQGTGMTAADTDQTLINLASVTTVTSGGILRIKHNRTSASDSAVASLAGKFTITEV